MISMIEWIAKAESKSTQFAINLNRLFDLAQHVPLSHPTLPTHTIILEV